VTVIFFFVSQQFYVRGIVHCPMCMSEVYKNCEKEISVSFICVTGIVLQQHDTNAHLHCLHFTLISIV